MNYKETDSWIKNHILKNGGFSLSFLAKEKKILDVAFGVEIDNSAIIDGVLVQIGKSFKKVKHMQSVSWFKVNLIDNAIPDIVGLGAFKNFNELQIITSLLSYDRASQSGDVIVGLFDNSKEWLIKFTNHQSENRVSIRLFGAGKVIELLNK